MSGCLTSRPKAAQPAWFTRWARGSHRWPTLSQLRRQHYPAFPRTCDTDGVKNWRCSAPSKGSFDGPISGFSSVVAFVSTFALLVSLELWAFTAPSSAEFISYGLATQNDGLLTLDSHTGLEWLDLTSTGNQSFASVIGGYGGFTTTYGLRGASRSEVSTLIEDAGGVNGFGSPASIDAASKLLLYFGVLQQFRVGSVTQYFSHGMFTPDQPGQVSPSVAVINLIFEYQTPIQGQT